MPKQPIRFNEPYDAVDLTAPSRVVSGRLPALEAIQERLSRQLRADLFRFLRYGVDIEEAPTRFDQHDDVMASLGTPVFMGVVTMAPLRGFSLIAISGDLVGAAVDRLCGATEQRDSPPRNDLSLFEARIANRLLSVACASVEYAWQGVVNLNIEVVRTEMNKSFVSIADSREPLITMRMGAKLSTGGGDIVIGTPFPSVESIRDKLGSTAAMTEAPEGDRVHWARQMRESVVDVMAPLRAELSRESVPARTVSQLDVGQILPIRVTQQARVYCGDTPVMTAAYGRRGESNVLRVEQFESKASDNNSEQDDERKRNTEPAESDAGPDHDQ